MLLLLREKMQRSQMAGYDLALSKGKRHRLWNNLRLANEYNSPRYIERGFVLYQEPKSVSRVMQERCTQMDVQYIYVNEAIDGTFFSGEC